MVNLIWIGGGGFFGAIMRYLLIQLIHRNFDKVVIPYGTATVNLIGCFLIGFLSGVAHNRQFLNPEIRSMLFVGFLGGFTTFSTFALEGHSLLKSGNFSAFGIYYVGQLILGLLLVWIGLKISLQVA